MPQPPVGQTFNVGSPFNIPPMMFGGSPNTSNTPYQRPSYSSSQPMVFAQNQPGYPIPPSNPQFGMNWNQNPQSSQSAPRGQSFDSHQQYPVPTDTNPSQSFAGHQPKYTQGAYQPQNPSSHPLSGPGGPPVYSPPHNSQPDQYPTYTQPQGYGSYPKPSSGYPQNSQPQSQPGYSPNQFYNTPNSTRPGFENRQDEPQTWKPQYNQGSPYSGHQPNTFRNQPPSVSPFHNSPSQGNQPGSTPNFQPQYSQPPNPNFPQNSRYPQNTQFVFPSSQTGSGNPSTYPSQYSGGSHSPDPNLPTNPQSNTQNPQGYFPSSQQGSGYPPANSESPYYPNYNPNIPQNVGSPSGYNPQPQGEHSASRGFETPQYSPQVPAQGQTPTGHPQSREPQIFPQGGQPGYFLVNQKENEPPIKRPPPKYNPVDSSKQSARCPKGASGLFPHPNCFKFLNCDHGRTFVMDCAPGTAFNPDISTCDFPDNVDCGKTISGPDPGSNEGEVVEADKNNDDYDGTKEDGSRPWEKGPPATVGKEFTIKTICS